MKNFFEYENDKSSIKTTICTFIIIMIVSGIFGFIYETILYRIDLGYFVKRGTTFGPYIPIYAFGGIFIALFTYKIKNKPLLVFLINTLITGLLEYTTGYVLYEYSKIRLWDYNNEILNFGNINGYVCLRSVLLFGLSSLLLIYVFIPNIKKFVNKISEKKLLIISIILITIFFLDMIIYRIIN